MSAHSVSHGLNQGRHHKSQGFTLIEMLGVLVISALIVGSIVDFYIDLSHANARAVRKSREARQVVTLLDYIATDIQAAFLIQKDPEKDPLTHPWLFVGTARGKNSRLLFFTRHTYPHGTKARDWDVARVAYLMAKDAEGETGLWRYRSIGLPSKQDREFPEPGDPGLMLLSREVETFHLDYMDATEGQWSATWDSTTLAHSGDLPLAVRVKIQMKADASPTEEGHESTTYTRVVPIWVRPLESKLLFGNSAEAGTDDPICQKRGAGADVFQCTKADRAQEIQDIVDSASGEQCFYRLVGIIDEQDGSLFNLQRSPACRQAYDNYWEDQ